MPFNATLRVLPDWHAGALQDTITKIWGHEN